MLGVLAFLLYYFYPAVKLPENVVVDRIVVLKSKRKMRVYSGEKLLKTYRVALGKNPVGHKQFEGDFRTPEGIYHIDGKNPNSGFYKNLGISYPNEQDLAFAENQGKPAGGAIKIHGLRNGRGYRGKFHIWRNWTAGCIAVTNREIDELFKAVPIGTIIEIRP